jgi:DNA-binding CsgD family transcriptional regulator
MGRATLELERKSDEMMHKNAELASFSIQVSHKNKILTDISNELKTIYPKLNEAAQRDIKKLIKEINSDILMDNDWERFVKSFEQVHDNFFKKLKETYPDLTVTDLKLCAYIRMKLSSKEIAALMNNSLRGVEKARYRLRKKLNLSNETNLIDFIGLI